MVVHQKEKKTGKYMQWKIIMSIQNKQESIILQTEIKNKAE